VTTVTKPSEPTVGAAAAPRMLSIAANLLPPETIEARITRKVRRMVLACLAVFVLALGGWYAFASYELGAARTSLDAAQGNAYRLKQQQNEYNELTGIQSQARTARSDLSTLLADDLQWAGMVSSLRLVAPPGVTFSSIDGSLAGGDAKGAPASGAPTTTGTTGKRVVVKVMIDGTAPSKPVLASYLDALAQVPGVVDALVTDATIEQPAQSVTFALRLNVTSDVLGGRFTPAGGDK